MAARAPAGGEHGGAAAEGEAKLASAKTRSDYEHAVKRLEGMNLNLKLRVAQLEEELEHDSTAGADASAQPSMDHGPAAEASAQPSTTTASTLGEDAASARVSADLEKRREALDGEWEAVQKLHEEVAALKMEHHDLPHCGAVSFQLGLSRINQTKALSKGNATNTKGEAEAGGAPPRARGTLVERRRLGGAAP
jgi:hypothetical protein